MVYILLVTAILVIMLLIIEEFFYKTKQIKKIEVLGNKKFLIFKESRFFFIPNWIESESNLEVNCILKWVKITKVSFTRIFIGQYLIYIYIHVYA